MLLKGQTENAGHFLQPAAIAIGSEVEFVVRQMLMPKLASQKAKRRRASGVKNEVICRGIKYVRKSVSPKY